MNNNIRQESDVRGTGGPVRDDFQRRVVRNHPKIVNRTFLLLFVIDLARIDAAAAGAKNNKSDDEEDDNAVPIMEKKILRKRMHNYRVATIRF